VTSELVNRFRLELKDSLDREHDAFIAKVDRLQADLAITSLANAVHTAMCEDATASAERLAGQLRTSEDHLAIAEAAIVRMNARIAELEAAVADAYSPADINAQMAHAIDVLLDNAELEAVALASIAAETIDAPRIHSSWPSHVDQWTEAGIERWRDELATRVQKRALTDDREGGEYVG